MDCEGGHVTLIFLPDIGLIGSLPPEIADLRHLETLSLRDNSLTGIPPEIGALTHLAILDLGGNGLSALPSEIGGLSALASLELGSNELTALPASVGQLTALTHLGVALNSLTGDISAWADPLAQNATGLDQLLLGDGPGHNNCLFDDNDVTATWLTDRDEIWDECDAP